MGGEITEKNSDSSVLFQYQGIKSLVFFYNRVKGIQGEDDLNQRKWKRVLALFLTIILMVCGNGVLTAYGEENKEADGVQEDILIQAPAGILIEADTGTVLYKKSEEEKRSPASITKIMTLLLIFDSLADGNLKLTDTVTTSAYAKSMGGSQVFLEEGETQDVETMIKCIVIASGNDASVAMAEHIAGSEQEFVKRMNQRAEQLGMQDTHFEDCCGLTRFQRIIILRLRMLPL